MKTNFFLIFGILLLVFSMGVGDGRAEVYEAETIPWSGYWWPFTEGALVNGSGYRNSPSPLEKYDQAVNGESPGLATEFGRMLYYKPDGLDWEGFCFNWAAASILEPEPVQAGSYNGTTFYVGDKKGLLTVAYHGVLINRHPISNPQDFQEILERFIRNQKVPVMIDMGGEGEVWYYPVFKYESQFDQIGDTRHYRTTIFYADNNVRPDYVGSRVSQITYGYFFRLDPNGEILESGWEGENASSPPIRAAEPIGTIPQNPGIDYDTLQEIVNCNDDSFRGNHSISDAAKVSSGVYDLLSVEADYFRVPLREGNRLKVRIESYDWTPVSLRAFSESGASYGDIAGNGELDFQAEESGDFLLEISPYFRDYQQAYRLILDHSLEFQQIIPINPRGFWRSGVALLHESQPTHSRSILSLFDHQGELVSGHFFDSEEIQHSGMLEQDFNLIAGGGYVRVDTDLISSGLFSASLGEKFLIGTDMIPMDVGRTEVFIPHIAVSEGWSTSLGLINLSDGPRNIQIDGYGQSGEILQSQIMELGSGEKMEKDVAEMDFFGDGVCSASARIEGEDGLLVGYVTLLNPSFLSRGRTIIPLNHMGIQDQPGDILLPHVAVDEGWNTGLALMNISENLSDVIIFAYDSGGSAVDTVSLRLRPKENFVEDIGTLFNQQNPGDIASLRVQTANSASLTGFAIYESHDRLQLAGVPLQTASYLPTYLPHIAAHDPWWTGIGLMNAGNRSSEAILTLFDENANALATRNITLGSNQSFRAVLGDVFPEEEDALFSARYMRIGTPGGVRQGLSGVYLMGTGGEDARLMGGILR